MPIRGPPPRGITKREASVLRWLAFFALICILIALYGLKGWF